MVTGTVNVVPGSCGTATAHWSEIERRAGAAWEVLIALLRSEAACQHRAAESGENFDVDGKATNHSTAVFVVQRVRLWHERECRLVGLASRHVGDRVTVG